MSEIGMVDGMPIVLQRRFDAPIYAVWKVVFHDFWCQVALVALLQELHWCEPCVSPFKDALRRGEPWQTSPADDEVDPED